MPIKSVSNPKVIQAVDSLSYPYPEFEIRHFLDHVERCRNRKIVLRGVQFSSELFGLWIPAETHDYILYNTQTYLIHRVHTILHEVGHILLGHRSLPLEVLLESSWYKALEREFAEMPKVVLPRQYEQGYVRSDPQEAEAEDFATLMQSRIIRAGRLDYLTRYSTSIERLRPFTDCLGY